MNILSIARAIKKISVNEIKDFIFENYYKLTGFSKEISCYSMSCLKKKYLWLLANKLIEKTPHPCNAKEHYQSFIRKKNIKSEILTYQPKLLKTQTLLT